MRLARHGARLAAVPAGVLGAVLAGSLALAGCGSAVGSPGSANDLLVFAAASLTESFEEIGSGFEDRNSGVTVSFNFGPSDGLATQILEGAPADVFASASQRWMDVVHSAAPGVSVRSVFARNRLVVLVPAGNPAGIGSIENLGRPGIKLVVAASGVPAGDYAMEALDRAGILEAAEANVVSREEDVKGVVQKVLLGEADAGIAYATDASPQVAGRVEVLEIPVDANVETTYPIAVVGGSRNEELGSAFVEFVLGEGQAVLDGFGFLPPA
jgi:molybdate transport system substrate-binding protein